MERRDLAADVVAERLHNEFEEYKKFAFKGDMFKMAIAFILGGAFGKVVSSISNDLLMPLMAFITSYAGDHWKEATWTPVEGLVLETGKFVGTMLEFLLVSMALFIIVKIVTFILQEKPSDGSQSGS